jgi:TPR repeat protein
MKTNQLLFTVLLPVTAAVFQLPAQQNEADRKVLDEIRAGADKGDAKARYELGRAFFSGTLGVAKDETEAVKWFRKAAEQNVADAQFSLGVCYAIGQGVMKDDAEAVKWFRKAAEQSDARAQYNLGVRYTTGQGVAKDDAEAVKWFRKAAEQDLADAQYNLGACYDSGEGVAKDEIEAYKWWLLAAGHGNEDAKYNITTVENKMTREQIAEGQRRARDFKPRKAPSEGRDARLPP